MNTLCKIGNYLKLHIFIISALILLGSASLAHAQDQTNAGKWKASSIEDMAIAFYKTGGVKPSFTNWAKEMDPYLSTAQARREEVLSKEVLRLRTKYKEYDPDNDLLLIKTDALIHFDGTRGPQTMRLEFRKGHIDHFPYQFLDQVIAVVPHKIQDLMVTEVTEEQAEFIRKNTRRTPRKGLMVIELAPKQADLSRPHDLDGTMQWLFLTDVVHLSLWGKGGVRVWEYNNPAYLTAANKEFEDLFTQKRDSTLKP